MGWNTRFRWTIPLLLGLFVAGLGVENAAAQDAGNLYDTGVDRRLGERYFQRQCSRCHGQDATGNDETGAPDLTGTLSNASTSAGIFSVIREGITGTAMLPISAETPDASVWQLVTYIESLSTDPANIDLPGSARSGQQVYAGKGNCASCHMINGEGARQGPDLSRVGERRDPDELATDLTDPHEDVAPRWWTVKVTRQDGSVIEGLRMNEDTFTLRIIDQDENLWSFSKKEISSYERIEDSTMPSYEQTLTASEVDDLVAYLFSLRKES